MTLSAQLTLVVALLGADPTAEPRLPPAVQLAAPVAADEHFIGPHSPPPPGFFPDFQHYQMYYDWYDPWRVHPPHVADPSSWANWWVSPGDMVIHPPYYPARHGYYYYRPYNVTHIPPHQEFVTRWGEDPRHPYANEVFKRVYAEMAAERGEEVPLPPVLPAPVRPNP